MDEGHLTYLASAEWAATLREELLPWLDATTDLGDDVLEIGPGPGLTTDLLRQRVARLTAVEVDPDLAAALRKRLAGTNVEVVWGDAARLDATADRFSAATCFSVLHHVPSADHQDRVFAEVLRVLHAGAELVAVDSLDTDFLRHAHADGTFVPLDPQTLSDRLGRLGFVDVGIEPAGEYQFRFVATKP